MTRRLLSVIHGPVFGGGFNQMIKLRDPLQERGVHTVAGVPIERGNALERLRAADMDIELLRLHRLRATPNPRVQLRFAASLLAEVAAIRRVIRERDIDVVQAHGDTNPHAAIAAHLEGRAVVWQLYDTRTPVPLRKITMPLVVRLADVITTWGTGLAQAHPGALELGPRQITVFPPVDTGDFYPDPGRRKAARQELGAGPETFLVGTIGNRNPSKGHEWLVRALAQARKVDRRIEGRILGAPSPPHAAYERQVRAEAEQLGLGDALAFVDPGDRVPDLIGALDALVLSSVPRSEGIPTVILEAMACRIPVIATDVGAIREVVEPEVTGMLVPPEDSAALAASILRIASDPALRERLAEIGLLRVQERYTLDRCADTHLKAYELASEHRLGRQVKGRR